VSTLHITNGDTVADKLRAVMPGRVSIMADVLHEGPAAEVDGPPWREQRAQYLASAGYTSADQARSTLAEWDEAIARASDHTEAVLWFEHDLFDQLLLIRTLDLLNESSLGARPEYVSLICLNQFLGHLTPEQLRALWPTRAPVTDAQYAAAHNAWWAYRQGDPSALMEVRRRLDSDRAYRLPLPFLGDALERFFEEFPSTLNGLSRTADTALRVLVEAGTLSGPDLFRRTQALEARPFLGDSSLFQTVRDLADAQVPLVTIGRGPMTGTSVGNVAITDAGRDVVQGREDAVRLNGIDQWRGGVHLAAGRPAWRWDPARKTLVLCK
jgi:hypothetical protein